MEDSSGAMYKIAIQLGVSDALARGFRADLKDFKNQYQHAKALVNMGQ